MKNKNLFMKRIVATTILFSQLFLISNLLALTLIEQAPMAPEPGTKIDVNTPENDDGVTPLMSAASNDNIEEVKWLLSKGAKLDTEDQRGFSALTYAALLGDSSDLKVFSYLITKIGKNQKLLDRALYWGATGPKTAKLLIVAGANPNYVGEDEKKNSVLIKAVGLTSELEIIKNLLEHGANINYKNAKGDTALSKAKKRLEKLQNAAKFGKAIKIEEDEDLVPVKIAGAYHTGGIKILLDVSPQAISEMINSVKQIINILEEAEKKAQAKSSEVKK